MSKLLRVIAASQVFILITLRRAKVIALVWLIKKIVINRWSGELGNNLIQIANASLLAQKNNASISTPTHGFLQTQKRFLTSPSIAQPSYDNIIFTAQILLNDLRSPTGLLRPVNTFFRTFFYQFDTSPFQFKLSDYRNILSQLAPDLIPYTVDPRIHDETLVIHLRSGDAFAPHAHMAYVQPPLSFYQAVIKASNCQDIVVVTQSDLANPCVAALQQSFPNLRVQSGTLEEDVNTILSAKHLVAGVSSFSLALAFCSSHLRHFYVPRLEVKPGYWRVKLWAPLLNMTCQSIPLDLQGLDFKIHPVEITQYIQIGDWRNSTKQRSLMLNHRQDDLKFET